MRISATDWTPGGIECDDAVEIARAFADAGADAIDVSTGQVTPDEKPAFGRSYQTPYADAIRNRVGIATIAVGVISSYDDVNSILLAGRADLCAVGRAHLYDPNWTLHAAADQGYRGPAAEWPDPWKAGSRGRKRDAPTGRSLGCSSSARVRRPQGTPAGGRPHEGPDAQPAPRPVGGAHDRCRRRVCPTRLARATAGGVLAAVRLHGRGLPRPPGWGRGARA